MSAQEALAAAVLATQVNAGTNLLSDEVAAWLLAYPFTPDQRRALAAHFLDADALAEALQRADGVQGFGGPEMAGRWAVAILLALGAKP